MIITCTSDWTASYSWCNFTGSSAPIYEKEKQSERTYTITVNNEEGSYLITNEYMRNP